MKKIINLSVLMLVLVASFNLNATETNLEAPDPTCYEIAEATEAAFMTLMVNTFNAVPSDSQGFAVFSAAHESCYENQN